MITLKLFINFSKAVSNQLSSSQQTTKLKEEETAKQTQEQIVKEVKRELEDQRHRYETELVTLRKECEERVRVFCVYL